MKGMRVIVSGLCAAMILASVSGCGQKKADQPAASETAASAAESIAESTAQNVVIDMESEADQVASQMNDLGIVLPFVYTGDEPYMNEICIWAEREFGPYMVEDGTVLIPAPVILYTDDSDPEDIKIWGNFWAETYTLEEETLVSQSGGESPGLLHLKKTGEDSYEVTGFDRVGDGSDYNPDVERIFGNAPQEAGDLVQALYETGDSRNGKTEEVRKTFIRMYADSVPQTIRYYQDYGWDPVPVYEDETEDET